MPPSAVDALSVTDQYEMAAFVYAEGARCPNGHPLMLSLLPEPFEVEDQVCEWCKGLEAVRDRDEKRDRRDHQDQEGDDQTGDADED